jgi:serine/threonine protein kinase
VSTSFTELVNAVLYEPPPPLPPSTSNHLVHLVMGLLAKDPRERLQVRGSLSPPPVVHSSV